MTTRSLSSVLTLMAALAVGILLSTAPVGAQMVTLSATLSGANEVPPVMTDTMGQARVTLTVSGGMVTTASFRLDLLSGVRVTQAHLHCAPAGQNGPIVAYLAGFHDRGWDVNGRWSSATLTDANVIPSLPGGNNCPVAINNLTDIGLAALNGNIYVNAHSTVFPGGVVRGQLTR